MINWRKVHDRLCCCTLLWTGLLSNAVHHMSLHAPRIVWACQITVISHCYWGKFFQKNIHHDGLRYILVVQSFVSDGVRQKPKCVGWRLALIGGRVGAYWNAGFWLEVEQDTLEQGLFLIGWYFRIREKYYWVEWSMKGHVMVLIVIAVVET